jgi:hypothetical protein
LAAALQDAGAQFSGHPADAGHLNQQIALNRQFAQQQALRNTPYTGDPASFMQSLVAAGVNPDTAIQYAGGLRSLQPTQTLSPDEVTNLHLNPQGVYQRAPGGAISTVQAPDTLSQAAVNQKLAMDKVTPITDPNDPRLPPLNVRPPGAIYGTDAAGNLKQILSSDAKSPLAQKQALSDKTASMEAQMRLYGLGNGAGGDVTQNPTVQSYKSNILAGNMTMQNVPQMLRGAVSVAMTQSGKTDYAPIAQQRMTTAASKITAPYTKMSAYQLTADAAPYLARIDAASKVPGSVSDQDLLDSLTKLNTGGNAVTDAQVRLITDGKSFSDWAGTLKNKFNNGGVLSDNQRQQIREIAGNIYQNYRATYQPVYDKASQQLTDAGIPRAFWTIPDLNTIGDKQVSTFSGSNGKKTMPISPSQLPQKQSAPVRITGDADYAQLPSGSLFIGPDGHQRRKP